MFPKSDFSNVAHLWVRERDHLEDPGVDENIILRSTFRNLDVGA